MYVILFISYILNCIFSGIILGQNNVIKRDRERIKKLEQIIESNKL